MTSSRPYLLRAIYDWIQDNYLTPHIMVDAHGTGVRVPQEYVQDGQIILNISSAAAMNLVMTDEYVSFNARFRGVPMDVTVPVESVLGIYARENGQGMMFAEGTSNSPVPPTPPVGGGAGSSPPKTKKAPAKGKPSLTLVK